MSQPTRPVIFGEVLYDCFPDGRQVLGGAPFNVAWHLQAFGLKPYFISRIGDDELGRKIKSAMTSWGMDVSGLQVDPMHPTGTVEVSIENNEPSYEIVNHRAWDYIGYEISRNDIEHGILYHGSLALRNAISKATLDKIKKEFSLPIFIDVNLRSPWWQKDFIGELIEDGQIIKLNEHELSLIVPNQDNLKSRVQYLIENTKIKTLIVTRGAAGAIAALSSGEYFHIEAENITNLADTVGAGDAFSSVLLLGTIRKWPLSLAMERAQQFASRIIAIQGATTEDRHFYDVIINNWDL
ncbi:MAG: carbohydrate kinase [Gammaproteobacteria bacterium]|nr:carbohydrate kinase [Gammaproteobacteria bacterium]